MSDPVTHSFAILEVSALCFYEIKHKLQSKGYSQAVIPAPGGGVLIDLNGLALGLSQQTELRGMTPAALAALKERR